MALNRLYREDIRPGISGNVVTLTGGDNVRSALENRLSTPLRSIPFLPDYGIEIKQFLNLPMTADNKSRILNEVVTQVSRDPRVKEVRNSELRSRDDGLIVISVDIVLVGTNEPLNVEVRT